MRSGGLHPTAWSAEGGPVQRGSCQSAILQLHDRKLVIRFRQVCSCEVVTEPNLSQALHLLNGNSVHFKIKQGKLVKRLLDEKMPVPEIVNSSEMTS